MSDLARCLSVLAVLIASPAVAEDWSWDQQPDQSFALKAGDQVVWQFNYAAELPKPYFHPVAVPGGPVVTWDRPPDHVWHHGLWFSWKFINGLNYWEPDATTGKPQGNTAWDSVQVTKNPDHSARITMNVNYGPHGDKPVLVERRVIEISAPESEGSYSFDWDCKFTAFDRDVEFARTPLEGEPGGQPWGGYAGLSIRLAKDLTDRLAVTNEGPVDFGQSDRYRGKAPALEYQASIGDQSFGITVCDHPDNLNHPSPWYVIRATPMSYFSPAVICYGPYTLPAGQSFTLRYRVLIHPQRWNAERIGQEFQRYVGQQRRGDRR